MEILKAGYGLDEDGYIVSDADLDKIDNAYTPCIQHSVDELAKLFPQQMHSIYVYGSVARGDAVAPKSDLDLLVLFYEVLNTEEKEELDALAKFLSGKYESLVRDVGIASADYEYVTNPENYYEQAFIKELSVCVHGEDIRERFGPYKLIPEIALSFNGDIAEALARTMARLKAAPAEDFKVLTQNFSRKLIRTYYSMVMVRSQVWSTRIREQSAIFIHFFPHKEPSIRTLNKWIEEPSANQKEVFDLFEREGYWAAENFKQEVHITS